MSRMSWQTTHGSNQLPSDEAGRWQHILQQKAQQGASIGPGVTSGLSSDLPPPPPLVCHGLSSTTQGTVQGKNPVGHTAGFQSAVCTPAQEAVGRLSRIFGDMQYPPSSGEPRSHIHPNPIQIPSSALANLSEAAEGLSNKIVLSGRQVPASTTQPGSHTYGNVRQTVPQMYGNLRQMAPQSRGGIRTAISGNNSLLAAHLQHKTQAQGSMNTRIIQQGLTVPSQYQKAFNTMRSSALLQNPNMQQDCMYERQDNALNTNQTFTAQRGTRNAQGTFYKDSTSCLQQTLQQQQCGSGNIPQKFMSSQSQINRQMPTAIQAGSMEFSRMPQPAHQQKPCTVQFHRPQTHLRFQKTVLGNQQHFYHQQMSQNLPRAGPHIALTNTARLSQDSGHKTGTQKSVGNSGQQSYQTHGFLNLADIARFASNNMMEMQIREQKKNAPQGHLQKATSTIPQNPSTVSGSREHSPLICSQFPIPQTGPSSSEKEAMKRWYAQPSDEDPKDSYSRSGTHSSTESLLLQMLRQSQASNTAVSMPGPADTEKMSFNIQVSQPEPFQLKPTVCNEHVIEYKVADLLRCLHEKKPRSRHSSNAALSSDRTTPQTAGHIPQNSSKPCTPEPQCTDSHLRPPSADIAMLNPRKTPTPVPALNIPQFPATDESLSENLQEAFFLEPGAILDEHKKRMLEELTLNASFGTQDMNPDIDYRLYMPATPMSQERSSTPDDANNQQLLETAVAPNELGDRKLGNSSIAASDESKNPAQPDNSMPEQLLASLSSSVSEAVEPDNTMVADIVTEVHQEISDQPFQVGESTLTPPRVEVEVDEVPNLQIEVTTGQKRKTVDVKDPEPKSKRMKSGNQSNATKSVRCKKGKGKSKGMKRKLPHTGESQETIQQMMPVLGGSKNITNPASTRDVPVSTGGTPKPFSAVISKPEQLHKLLHSINTEELPNYSIDLFTLKNCLEYVPQQGNTKPSCDKEESVPNTKVKPKSVKTTRKRVCKAAARSPQAKSKYQKQKTTLNKKYKQTRKKVAASAKTKSGKNNAVSTVQSQQKSVTKCSVDKTQVEDIRDAAVSKNSDSEPVIDKGETICPNADAKENEDDMTTDASTHQSDEVNSVNVQNNEQNIATETVNFGDLKEQNEIPKTSGKSGSDKQLEEKSTTSKETSNTGGKVVLLTADHKMLWVRFHGKVVTKLVMPEGSFFIMTEILRRCFRIKEPRKNKTIQDILIKKKNVLKIPDVELPKIFYEAVVRNLLERQVIKTVPTMFTVIGEEDAKRLFHYILERKYCGEGCVTAWTGPKLAQADKRKQDVASSGEAKCSQQEVSKTVLKRDVVNIPCAEIQKERHNQNNFDEFVINLCSDNEDGYHSDYTVPYVDGKPYERQLEVNSELAKVQINNSVEHPKHALNEDENIAVVKKEIVLETKEYDGNKTIDSKITNKMLFEDGTNQNSEQIEPERIVEQSRSINSALVNEQSDHLSLVHKVFMDMPDVKTSTDFGEKTVLSPEIEVKVSDESKDNSCESKASPAEKVNTMHSEEEEDIILIDTENEASSPVRNSNESKDLNEKVIENDEPADAVLTLKVESVTSLAVDPNSIKTVSNFENISDVEDNVETVTQNYKYNEKGMVAVDQELVPTELQLVSHSYSDEILVASKLDNHSEMTENNTSFSNVASSIKQTGDTLLDSSKSLDNNKNVEAIDQIERIEVCADEGTVSNAGDICPLNSDKVSCRKSCDKNKHETLEQEIEEFRKEVSINDEISQKIQNREQPSVPAYTNILSKEVHQLSIGNDTDIDQGISKCINIDAVETSSRTESELNSEDSARERNEELNSDFVVVKDPEERIEIDLTLEEVDGEYVIPEDGQMRIEQVQERLQEMVGRANKAKTKDELKNVVEYVIFWLYKKGWTRDYWIFIHAMPILSTKPDPKAELETANSCLYPCWKSLPDHLLLPIFQYLDAATLAKAGLVCRGWNRVAFDELLWKDLFYRHWGISRSIQMAPGKHSWIQEYRRLLYHTPSVESEILKQHADQVLHVSFAHNGKMFATCSKDGFIRVWDATYPTTLKYKADMRKFTWKCTQFSQFNSSDTLLLVSGIHFGSASTSGEIAVFSLEGEFVMQSRAMNKPYDVFGTWYNDFYLLSGNLHWTGHLNSCSAIWLNKAYQETGSEEESVVMRLFKFSNINASSIRIIMIANCLNEETVKTPGEKMEDGSSSASSFNVSLPVIGEQREQSANRDEDDMQELSEIESSCYNELEDVIKPQKSLQGIQVFENGEFITKYLEVDTDVPNNRLNGTIEYSSDYRLAEDPKEPGLCRASGYTSSSEYSTNGNHSGSEMSEKSGNGCADTCDQTLQIAEQDLEKSSQRPELEEMQIDVTYNVSTSCTVEHVHVTVELPAPESSTDHGQEEGQDAGAISASGEDRGATRQSVSDSTQKSVSVISAARQGSSQTNTDSHTSTPKRVLHGQQPGQGEIISEPSTGEFPESYSCDMLDSTDELPHRQSKLHFCCVDYKKQKKVSPIKTESGKHSRLRVSRDCKMKQSVDLSDNQSVAMENIDCVPGRSQARLCSQLEETGSESINDFLKPRLQDFSDYKYHSQTSPASCVPRAAQSRLCLGSATLSVEDMETQTDLEQNTKCLPGRPQCNTMPSSVATATIPQNQGCQKALSVPPNQLKMKRTKKGKAKKIKDKYLIFSKGSETYTPHQIGIKRIKPLHAFSSDGSRLLPNVMETTYNSDQQGETYDEVDHLIDMHGHIIGMTLSPDHRYLYVNSRPWPKNYHIENPLYPPPIAQEIDIHVIDLLNMREVGTMHRAHKAYTSNDECFFIFLDVCEEYVASGAEDRHGYLWDRHYGLCLHKYPHTDVVNSVAFNPTDPEVLVTVSDDFSIKIWRSLCREKEVVKAYNREHSIRLKQVQEMVSDTRDFSEPGSSTAVDNTSVS